MAMRRNIWKASLSFLLVLCGLLLGSKASAQTQSPVTIDAPGAGTGQNQGTSVAGINDGGWITGYYYDANQSASTLRGCHAFVRNPDGTFVTFDGPDNPSCIQPVSISSSGVVTG